MHKLVILIEFSDAFQAAEGYWPEFLHLVEDMPGLRRETTSRVERRLLGPNYAVMHELYFDSLAEAEAAMTSDKGRLAGGMLQRMSGGKVSLFLADHREDALENIMKYRQTES